MFRTVIITSTELSEDAIRKTQARFGPDFTCIIGNTAPQMGNLSHVRYDKISLPIHELGLPIEHLEEYVYAIARKCGYFLAGDKVLITGEIDPTIKMGLFALACKRKAYPVDYLPQADDPFQISLLAQLAYKIFLGSNS